MYLKNSFVSINNKILDDEACTVIYVGKNVSKNNLAIVARSADTNPCAMNMNVSIIKRNALANIEVTSNKGFKYTMPSSTYSYISTPRNRVINKGNFWEASAINENGVGVSATLSCHSNSFVDKYDPFINNGVSEDNIAQIIGALAKSAKEGVKLLANIIDKQGSCNPDAIMFIDQNEVWYMEIYSGHQYLALKCPDDVILTAGNEFIFDTISEYDINQSDVIASPNLFKLAKDNGFLKPKNANDFMHMNLFKTYARALNGKEDRLNNDCSHRRTWRGINLFAKNNYPNFIKYDSETKYPSFYRPDSKLSVHDVLSYLRDRYDDILNDVTNPNHEEFLNDDLKHLLRYIGIENAYQIHAIQSDSKLDKTMAITEWLSISNSNYTPFIPINNIVNKMSKYYTRVSSTYGYDKESAANIFKHLNSLAATNRKNYGIPIENQIKVQEKIYETEYNSLIEQIKDFDFAKRQEILSNYLITIQDRAIKTTKFLIDDLTWHMMSDYKSCGESCLFIPCVNIKDYASSFGYKYKLFNNSITLFKEKEKITFNLTNSTYRPIDKYNYRTLGEIQYKGNKENIDLVVKDNEFYSPLIYLSKYIKGEIVIDCNDYKKH